MTYGYTPGDRVVVFRDGRVWRDDLVFESVRASNQGFTLRAENGDRVRFTRSGCLHGGGTQGRHTKVYPKEQQALREKCARLFAGRQLATKSVFDHAEALSRLAYREIRQGETKNAREHANAILAALDQLDAAEQRYGVEHGDR